MSLPTSPEVCRSPSQAAAAVCMASARELHARGPRIATRVFLIQTVPAWSTNLTARVVRRPKLTITDPGLAARLLGGRLRSDPEVAGRLVETFVVGELRAQAEWSQARPNLFHFRDRDGAEVDLVLESGDGRVVGIEVKAGATVRAEDLRGLRLLEHRFGSDFAAGIVLCTAPEPQHLGGRLWILPISALWQRVLSGGR